MKILSAKFKILFLPLLLVLVIIAILFYRNYEAVSQKPIRNIVFISIDTCRADYLSCYGYKEKTTPCIDKIAEKGVLFSNVISPAPMTFPAHSTMMTGTTPPYHGGHSNLEYKLEQSNETLAEILQENGFTTGAIVSSFVLDSRFGLNQGFATYNDRFEEKLITSGFNERRGGEATRYARKWLEEQKQEKFFLFLHYFDPHEPYIPPEPFASRFKNNLYAGEIAYTDYCINQVVEKLKELGLFDSTLLILAGDHGEMLGEHKESHHSYYVYQSAVKVPMIFII